MKEMKIEEKLFDYIEGTLTPEEKAEVERLLASNPTLKGHLQLIQRTDELARRQPVTSLDVPNFTDVVMNRLEVSKLRAKAGNRLLWMATGIFVAIFAGIVAILPLFPSGSSESLIPKDMLPSVPTFDPSGLLTTLQDPSLIQLVIVASSIALLLALDRVLGRKMGTGLKTFF